MAVNQTNNPPFYKSFVAGAIGQTVDLTLGHPLNRIATAQQASPGVGTFIKTIRYLHGMNGFREFYCGLRWNMASASCKGATRWGINNQLFSVFEQIPKNIQDQFKSIVPVSVGLSAAAIETTMYLCPLESLKTREMTQGHKHVWKVVKQEGPCIFFRGWNRLYYRQAISWGTYLCVYDALRARLLDYKQGKPVTQLEKTVMNAATGTIACLLTTPFDMLRTQIQKDQPLLEKRTIRALGYVMQTHGIKGVYRSLPTRVLRSAWYAVSTFFIMDYLNALPQRMKL